MTLHKPARRPSLHPDRATPRRGSGFMTRLRREDVERAEIERHDTIPAPPPAFDDVEPPTLPSRK